MCQEQKIIDCKENSNQIVWFTPEMLLNNRTWSKMAFDGDDEEEEERLREEQEKIREEEENFKNILAARRFLYSIGEYELEEGEILE